MCGARTTGLVCNDCLCSLRSDFNRCKVCSRPIGAKGAVCSVCLSKKRFFVRGFSLFNYKDENVKRVIELLKFKGYYRLAELLYHFKKEIIQSGIFDGVDCLLAVPMHRRDILKRGFNQAVFIARALSDITGIKVDYYLLRKLKRTKHQVGLSAKEREVNLKGAFGLTKTPSYRRVVIVDDVFTTGSTINEIARLLLSCNVKSNFFCLSSTPGLKDVDF